MRLNCFPHFLFAMFAIKSFHRVQGLGQLGRALSRFRHQVVIHRNLRLLARKVKAIAEESPSVSEKLVRSTAKSPRKRLKSETPLFYCKSPITSLPMKSSSLSMGNITAEQEEIQLVVYGDPVPLARHRVTRYGIMYNPMAKKQKSFLDACAPFIPEVPLLGPIEASITFYFSRPKSHYGSGKNAEKLKEGKSCWQVSRNGKV